MRIRRPKRKLRRQLGVTDVEIDMERVEEMRARPEFYKKGASKIVEAACRITKRGEAWGFAGRKVFLADLAREVDIPMRRLAPILVHSNNLGWLELARADLVGAMDPKKVSDSEVVVGRRRDGREDASYHFIVIDPKDC